MPVPFIHATPRILGRRALTALAFFLVCVLSAGAAKSPMPSFSLTLESLGFQGVPAQYLLLGDSVFTVHFVDGTHLLVTFTSRGLLTRLPDAEETDNDQNVTAVLLELPSGKVLGRTVWRERDRGQYLWSIGHGRFILRNRSKLTLLDPMLGLAHEKPFEEQPFVELHRTVGYIAVSPGLISIESTEPVKPKPASTAAGSPASSSGGLIARTGPPPATSVQINFYRAIYDAQPGGKPDRLSIQSAGVVLAPNLIDIPATADGYLDIARQSSSVFLFDFQGHGGKRLELSAFETSCIPRPHFISMTEFVAFGCRGSDDRQELAGFNLHGEEPWVNAFPNHHLFPSVVPAPAAGRFAMSRTITTGSYIDPDNLVPDQIGAQEISVIQNWDGRSLFKLAATPFQRSGQNFDLSPDGLTLAIIHESKIQTYPLPALSRKDEAAVKLAATFAPENTDARISLGGKPVHRNGRPEEKVADDSTVKSRPQADTEKVPSQTAPAAEGKPNAMLTDPSPSASSPGLAASPVESQAASARPTVRETNQTVNGDLDPSQRRSPPSLYTSEYPRQKGDPKPSADAQPK